MAVRSPLRSLPPGSPAAVWASLLAMGAGFGAVLVGWSIVAGTDDASAQVLPTLGLGLGGLVLVVGGTALLAVAVAHRDAVLLARRRRGQDARTTAEVPPRTVADRAVDLVLVAVAAGGVLAMVLGAHGAAREDEVQFARPYLVSGGFGGLSLLVAALGVLLVRARRRATVRAHLAPEVAP